MGDQVHDEESGRDAIVTDVRGGSIYVLRAAHGPDLWKRRNGHRLTVVVPHEEQDRAPQEPESDPRPD
ncbi:hypothetical protein OHA55_23695 [Streptomyces sp. NBC_00102]|nr:hypothetical protein [Streptomyces sp. NBC_00102]